MEYEYTTAAIPVPRTQDERHQRYLDDSDVHPPRILPGMSDEPTSGDQPFVTPRRWK